jgi:adhesin HecA-like repeat protein
MTINAKIECDRKSDIYGADYLEVKITAEIEEPDKTISAIYKIANLPKIAQPGKTLTASSDNCHDCAEYSCKHPSLPGKFKFKLLTNGKLEVTGTPSVNDLYIDTKQHLSFCGEMEVNNLQIRAKSIDNYGVVIERNVRVESSGSLVNRKGGVFVVEQTALLRSTTDISNYAA